MTLETIYTKLSAVNVPVYYDHTDNEAAELPYICYKEISARAIASDDAVTVTVPTVQVELYTNKRDRESEALVEAALNGCIWSRRLEFGDAEDYYEVIYTFEYIGG